MVRVKTIELVKKLQLRTSNLAIVSYSVGTMIYAIELTAGRVRKWYALLVLRLVDGKEGNYATIKFSSGEVHSVRLEATAAIGVVGNVQQKC